MEDLVNETWEDSAGRKNLSKINGKSLGALRQKLRKYIREGHEEEVAKFRENPDAEDDDEEEKGEEEEESDDGSDTDTRAKSEDKESKAAKSRKDKMMDEDEESDSEEWDSDDSSSDSDSDIIASTSTYTRDMFLKKVVDPEKEEERQRKKDKKMKDREDRKKIRNERKGQYSDEEDDDDDGGGWNLVDKSSAKVAMFPKDAEITNDLVIKKLAEIMAARGKKKTNRKEQIELLTELATIGQEHQLGPGIHIKIKFAIIAALFDYNPKLSDAMKPDSWEKCMKGVEELLDLLDEQVIFDVNPEQ